MDNIISFDNFNRMLYKSALERHVPLIGTFELTGRCNLRCRMCYVCLNAGDRAAESMERPASWWIDLGRQACELGMFYLLLTGGDVLLRKDFFEIYDGLSAMGVQIMLNTNALLVTPETVQKFKNNPPRRVAVTIYGASNETYAELCGDPRGYDKLLRGLTLLREAGLNVRARMCIVKGNIHDIDSILNLTHEMGFIPELVDFVFKRRGEGDGDAPEERLTPEAQISCLKRRREFLTEKWNLSSKAPNTPEPDDPELRIGQKDNAFQCAAGHYSFVVNWRGELTPCILLDQPYIDLKWQHCFADGWKALKKACDTVPRCVDCENCAYKNQCHICPAKLKGETGCFDQKAPYLCQMARLKSAE